ncbi:uncharacterized protein LOC126740687 [Anthonomus grandis grandis]|uniref:uncharacterized protein LOC126740687 n=1 Tax=Anthonomus grandis grandis TaxID=2921223 RepID=UPI002165D5BC|nr:uncharacterized protein LOC126740687 [Anthonomus grandis grandis]
MSKEKECQAYEILIEKLQTFNPVANRECVVKKINSLRTTYRKELKKVLDSERSGAGEEDIYVPHLWYYDITNFIRDHETPKNTKSNIEDMQVSDNESITLESAQSPDVSLASTPCSSTSTSQISSKRSQASQRGNDKCDEVLEVIGKRLKEQPTVNTDKFSDIGKNGHQN